ncbi:2-C-methyl-D-erythritol 2,4-cyclodiphosphate synthase [Leucobacter sp. Ag1]|nr:2-C-methyl-D-erythritol 4-phosphate cytidylyltransferase [Leucobacter sp. Ag1]KKI22455.1 2-C-methyl-D-erythritol 2,4-cyclodiphosphate synthase [Leucobacter sp. Ag1]
MERSPLANEHPGTGGTPHPIGSLGVVLVGAGNGTRLGAGVPKAFVEIGGRTLLEHALRAVTALPHAGHIAVVVPADRAAEALELLDAALPDDCTWSTAVVPGGRERHESVRFGIDALPDSVTTVLVHDAARPFASPELFDRVAAEVLRTGSAVVPALPVADTLKRVGADGIVRETVDRSTLVAVQTPQGFPRELLAAAHATAQLQDGDPARQEAPPTDDAEVVQRAGGTVRTVVGEQRAHKLTTPEDRAILGALLAALDGAADGAHAAGAR